MNLSKLKMAVLLLTSPFVPRTSIQAFFTTRPKGQETVLSLRYDIVKAHGVELKVDIIEGEGTSFIIQLPVKFTT